MILESPGLLQTERQPDGSRVLLRGFAVKWTTASKVRVPAGFLTDFGSVPAPARIFIKWSKVEHRRCSSRLPVMVPAGRHVQAPG